jgi:hypothetical protein
MPPGVMTPTTRMVEGHVSFPCRSEFRPTDIGDSRNHARTGVMLLSVDLLGGPSHVIVIHRDHAFDLGRGLLKSCARSGHASESPIGDQPSDECEQRAYDSVSPRQHAQSVRMRMWHESVASTSSCRGPIQPPPNRVMNLRRRISWSRTLSII